MEERERLTEAERESLVKFLEKKSLVKLKNESHVKVKERSEERGCVAAIKVVGVGFCFLSVTQNMVSWVWAEVLDYVLGSIF